MLEENLHAGGKWETMNFLGVELLFTMVAGNCMVPIVINDTLLIFIPSHYQRTQSCTMRYHPNHFILPQATLNTYKFSFYPRTIKDCNKLTTNIIEFPNGSDHAMIACYLEL